MIRFMCLLAAMLFAAPLSAQAPAETVLITYDRDDAAGTWVREENRVTADGLRQIGRFPVKEAEVKAFLDANYPRAFKVVTRGGNDFARLNSDSPIPSSRPTCADGSCYTPKAGAVPCPVVAVPTKRIAKDPAVDPTTRRPYVCTIYCSDDTACCKPKLGGTFLLSSGTEPVVRLARGTKTEAEAFAAAMSLYDLQPGGRDARRPVEIDARTADYAGEYDSAGVLPPAAKLDDILRTQGQGVHTWVEVDPDGRKREIVVSIARADVRLRAAGN